MAEEIFERRMQPLPWLQGLNIFSTSLPNSTEACLRLLRRKEGKQKRRGQTSGRDADLHVEVKETAGASHGQTRFAAGYISEGIEQAETVSNVQNSGC